jgi:hypothetical protein
MRYVLIPILTFSLGCATEMDGLFAASLDAGARPVRGFANPDARSSIDAGGDVAALKVDIRSEDGASTAIDSGASTDVIPIDTFPIDTTPINCMQRAINNGYAACAPDDPYHTSCAACNDRDPKTAADCKAWIDCMSRYSTCDQACYDKCRPPASIVSERCVFRVVTTFCGEQVWHPGASWGCAKAL